MRRVRLASLFVPGFVLGLVPGFAGGCGGSIAVPVPVEQGAGALGETVADRPAWAERVALYTCDRARMDPAATGWPDFAPVPPLLWDDRLGQSARAHSVDMRDTPCFQHDSCDGTGVFDRILSYWTDAQVFAGENISAGTTDGQEAIQNWIDEVGAPPGETGHRENMYSSQFHYVGFGYAPGGSRFDGYWTQDFIGVSPPPAVPAIPAGVHLAASPPAGSSVRFGAVYFDAGGAAPDRVEVVLDGAPTALSLARGVAAAGAYEGAVSVPAGCHRYAFRATRGATVSLYPDAGTLGLATAGAGACPDYAEGSINGGTDGGAGGHYYGGGGGCSMGGRPMAPPWLAGIVIPAIAWALALRRRRSEGR